MRKLIFRTKFIKRQSDYGKDILIIVTTILLWIEGNLVLRDTPLFQGRRIPSFLSRLRVCVWGGGTGGAHSKRLRLRAAYRRRYKALRIKLNSPRGELNSEVPPRAFPRGRTFSRFAKIAKRQERPRELAPLASAKGRICITTKGQVANGSKLGISREKP